MDADERAEEAEWNLTQALAAYDAGHVTARGPTTYHRTRDLALKRAARALRTWSGR